MTADSADGRLVDRARGVLLGLAVGDALGEPLEFLSAQEILDRYGVPVRDYVGGGWLDLEPGGGTDETALALALARSAATRIGYDPQRALDAYLEWFRADPPDVGAATRAALMGVEAGLSTAQATETFHRETGKSAGNGSLMRVAPIAVRHLKAADRRGRAARMDSKLTHYDDHAAEACAWLCDALAALIEGVDPGELAPPASLERHWEHARQAAEREATGAAAGYVGTALAVALAALRGADSFEDALMWTVNLGGDADTNGAVAGALLGARFGAGQIPSRWLDDLAAREEAATLAERLVMLACSDSAPEPGGPSTKAGGRQQQTVAPLDAS
jgi:ADP-ribosyl-[dinitrogen reductase] hydrolase